VIDLNKTDADHDYPAMTRPQVIDTFMDKVINHLRTQPNRVNSGFLFYYSYDSAGKSDMCDSPRSTPAQNQRYLLQRCNRCHHRRPTTRRRRRADESS
jgi:hypothetical protein